MRKLGRGHPCLFLIRPTSPQPRSPCALHCSCRWHHVSGVLLVCVISRCNRGNFLQVPALRKGATSKSELLGASHPPLMFTIPWARGQKCSVQIKGTMRARTVSFFAAMNQSTHVTPRPGKRRLQQLLRRTSEAVHQGTHASCQRSCGRSVKCGCHQAHNGLLPPSRSAPSLHCCVCV